MLAVETRSLTHRYGRRTALDDVSVAWPENRMVAVLGPNGSGKSTLFRILSTALVPESGTVRVAGFDVRTEPDAVRAVLGTVFQSPALDPELTVTENLEVFAALHGVSRRQTAESISALLRGLEIEDRARERVGRLSGGLRRRADLARSLVHAPGMLLLDEPTGGLDPSARAAFWSSLERIRSTRPLTLLVSTHDFEEAARSDHLVILDRGRIAVEGSPSGLVGTLGPEALWVECENPDAVRRYVDPGDVVLAAGRRVRISGPSPARTLMRLRDAPDAGVRSLELRPPDLSDVYEAATGRRWTESGEEAA
jgi:ABC-2 type transport system ATP-binding protein